MPGCIVSETTARLLSIGNRRLRAQPVITSTFENLSDIGVCLGLSLGPPAIAGVRSKQGALQWVSAARLRGSPIVIKEWTWSGPKLHRLPNDCLPQLPTGRLFRLQVLQKPRGS